MKKFLSKKSVMFTFIALAVAFLAFYIATLAWPVSYHTTYKVSATMGSTTVEGTIKFKSNKKAVMTSTMGSTTVKEECWVYFDGYSYYVVGDVDSMTKAEYKEEVKELKQLKKDNKALYENVMTKINAFKIDDEDYTKSSNTGAIVLAVVGGVLELVLIAGATLSVLARRKK